MALIHNNNIAVYSGVSKQEIDLRQPSYCEEMINCYPSIQNGVRRRSPTQLISSSISSEDNQFMHCYDRGTAGESSEKYVITIDKINGIKVFDIVANEYKTVSMGTNTVNYIQSSNHEIGFSAITIKDTTFIANKDIVPRLYGDESVGTINYKDISFTDTGYSALRQTVYKHDDGNDILYYKLFTGLAPARIASYFPKFSDDANGYVDASLGATINITIDGVLFKYTVNVINYKYSSYPESMQSMIMNIYQLLIEKIGTSYLVSIQDGMDIRVYKLNGTAIAISHTISYPSTTPNIYPSPWKGSFVSVGNIGSSTVISGYTSGTSTGGINLVSAYDKEAYVWISNASPDSTFPYTFTLTMKNDDGTSIGTATSSATTTTAVASAFAVTINTFTGFVATASGSVVKITRTTSTGYSVAVADTYGNQASSAWKGSITSMDDIPKSFPFKNTIIKVDGIQKADDIAYWIKYDGNSWVEWRDPNMLYSIRANTMPHKLTRNADMTFSFSVSDWSDIIVGDTKTQTIPEFIGSNIKDLFFVNGRLGILSSNGLSLSEQGDFRNFFRTTVLSLLDDSAISTYIDSNKSVGLQYAVELQGSIVIFGDKMQFALDASKPISPSTISIKPISGFEINRNVKPISSGDSIFFIVSKNGYSSLMEMNQNTLSMNIRADDVSSHVPNYINSDIVQLVASQKDGVIFLRSRNANDTIFVYKHYGTDSEKLQTAWSKWIFSMKINSIFVFESNLFLFGLRYNIATPVADYPLATIWNDTKFWDDTTFWVDGAILTTPSFEKLDIDAYDIGAIFSDNGTVKYNSTIELSEWMLSDKKELKELRGNLLIKTAHMSSKTNSNFSLSIHDKERGTTRLIPALYTVNRNPFVSGNAKNMVIKILSVNGHGFQINSISLEGQYNNRSKSV